MVLQVSDFLEIRHPLSTSEESLRMSNIQQYLTIENKFYRLGHFWTTYLNLLHMASS